MRPITDRQRAIVLALADADYALPPSQIASAIGMHKLPRVEGSGHGNGRGSGHRVFNPAQRIIGSLNGLKKRDIVTVWPRSDHLSGTAYGLTVFGEQVAAGLKEQAG